MYQYRGNKYGNRKVTVFNQTFDSKHEAQRYLELVSMQRAGKICELSTQVPFELIPAVRDDYGKLIQRSCEYIADFTYYDINADGTRTFVVEDAKGVRTEAYRIKRKLMLWRHGILVREV